VLSDIINLVIGDEATKTAWMNDQLSIRLSIECLSMDVHCVQDSLVGWVIIERMLRLRLDGFLVILLIVNWTSSFYFKTTSNRTSIFD
jgi:hypothetical protein